MFLDFWYTRLLQLTIVVFLKRFRDVRVGNSTVD